MSRLLGELEALLADVEHELGKPLLSDAADDALGVHLPESQQEHRSALLVVVMPAARKVILYDGRLLKSNMQLLDIWKIISVCSSTVSM